MRLNQTRCLAQVMRGVYPPVSSHYSQDIKDVIAKLLAVNPSHRPSVDDILKMPQVRALDTACRPGSGASSGPQCLRECKSCLTGLR